MTIILLDNIAGSFVDSEIVAEAISQLENEETEAQVEPDLDTFYYKVSLTDLETGMNYQLDKVQVSLSECQCQISSEALSFASKFAVRGRQANLVLIEQFGPSFVDQNLCVFEGQAAFTYDETVYCPAKGEKRGLYL